MGTEAQAYGSPEDWLRHARSDLAVARQRLKPGVLHETLCFHAQQAAEKSLKGVLLAVAVPFPYTHDLARLITLVRGAKVGWPAELDAAAKLSEYAVSTRYPGEGSTVSPAERREAVKLAQTVLSWAEKQIRQGKGGRARQRPGERRGGPDLPCAVKTGTANAG